MDGTPAQPAGGRPRRDARGRNAPGRRLAHEIAAALLFKALALIALYVAFFGPARAPEVSPAQVGQALFTERDAPAGGPAAALRPGERR